LRGSSSETSYTIEGLTPDTTYSIAVAAKNEEGVSEKSTPITVKTSPQTIIINLLPDAPTELVSTANTENSITISWTEVSGAVEYHVYLGTVMGSLTLQGSPSEPPYEITGLAPNETYYIAVSAENEIGEGDQCAVITVVTSLSEKPGKPEGLAVRETTMNSISVSWDSVAGAVSYKVFAGTTVAGMKLHGSPTETSYMIEELDPNTEYYIGVAVRTAFNESDQSLIKVVTKPAAPVDLAYTDVTVNSITVEWTAMENVSYTVYAGLTADNMTAKGNSTIALYEITGLTASTTYHISVSAENKSGEGEKSSVITVTTKQNEKPPSSLAAPENLEVGEKTGNSISISWESVSGASGYNVYAGTVAGLMPFVGNTAELSYLIEGLTPDVTYYIEVAATNGTVEGEKSSTLTVTINQGPKPEAPAGLAADDTTNSSIAVSWNSVSGATGYKVFAGTTAEDMTLRGNPTQTSFTIEELNTNTKYYIAVSTTTASSESDQSAHIEKYTRPAAPANLAAGTVTSNSIALTWTAMNGVTGYSVYAGTSSSNMTLRATNITTNSSTITGLSVNTTFYIAVAAKNASGEGSKSSEITVTTKLPAPEGVTAAPLNANTIQISWNAVTGASQYKIYRSDSATGTYSSIVTTPNAPYNDQNRDVATDYYYKVSAVTGSNNEGELSGYASARIPVQTKEITKFRFEEFGVDGNINGTNISVTVPNIVNLTTLAPTITHNGKSISTGSGTAMDFTAPKTFTVTAEDNTTKTYTVTVSVTNTTLATALAWINNNYSSGRTYTIVPQANESLGPTTISAATGVNIILKGGTAERTISLSSNGNLFTISSVTLTLDNNITLKGKNDNNASLVKVNSFGALIMNTGSKIQDNKYIAKGAYGGGVYINGGDFTLAGGTISGNQVNFTDGNGTYSNSYSLVGGGVYMESGTFTMNSGTITGNNSGESDMYHTAGGGVFVKAGTFTMNGGTISSNTAKSKANTATPAAAGGGVAVWNTGIFKMTGGDIKDNTVTTNAAGTARGGGVATWDSSTFTMTGGNITSNKATSSGVTSASYAYGGGVYAGNANFTKTGGNHSQPEQQRIRQRGRLGLEARRHNVTD